MTIIDSIKKMSETYQQAFNEAAWLERLLETHGGAHLHTLQKNDLSHFEVELFENEQRLRFQLSLTVGSRVHGVHFSMHPGDTDSIRRQLVQLHCSIEYGEPVRYFTSLDEVEESNLRELLNLREMPDAEHLYRTWDEIPLTDGVRYRDLAARMMQLRGSPQESSLAALKYTPKY